MVVRVRRFLNSSATFPPLRETADTSSVMVSRCAPSHGRIAENIKGAMLDGEPCFITAEPSDMAVHWSLPVSGPSGHRPVPRSFRAGSNKSVMETCAKCLRCRGRRERRHARCGRPDDWSWTIERRLDELRARSPAKSLYTATTAKLAKMACPPCVEVPAAVTPRLTESGRNGLDCVTEPSSVLPA